MSIVSAKCPNCGANLEINNSEEASICSACGSPFIVEKAINNYNISNHIENATINLNFDSEEFVIRDGVLIEYLGKSKNVIIPDGVTTIASGCFFGKFILSLECPESVKKIECCFGFLKSLSAPGLTEIAPSHFYECNSLIEVNIPNVETIGDTAFFRCENLEKINAPKLRSIGLKSFCGCTSLQQINFPNLCSLGNDSFMNCKKLNNVNIPMVENISSAAFESCESLETITAPNTKIISTMSFSHCYNLKQVDFPLANEIWSGAFNFCKNLQKVNCPNAILKIDNLYSSFNHFGHCECLDPKNIFLAVNDTHSEQYSHTKTNSGSSHKVGCITAVIIFALFFLGLFGKYIF